jgi:hypothetical protein
VNSCQLVDGMRLCQANPEGLVSPAAQPPRRRLTMSHHLLTAHHQEVKV